MTSLINRIKNIFKRKEQIAGKKIPLDLVYTFASGEKLYTYQQSNYGYISSRYWKAINEQLNYLTMYSLDKNTWSSAIDKMQQVCTDIVTTGNTKLAMDIYSALDYQKAIPMQKTAVQLKLHEVLFCMFFLLDSEIEGGYNEAMNAKKLELLNADPIAKDNFFFHVSEILKNLEISFQVDMPQMIAQIIELQKQSIQTILTENG